MAQKVKKRLPLIITAALIAFIWIQSMLPASVSASESRGLLAKLLPYFPFLTHNLLRKMAHFGEYAVLGASIAVLFRYVKKNRLLAIIMVFSVPFIDETIQIFSDGRGPLITDVWIDIGGIMTGIILAQIILHIIKRIKN